MPTGRIRTTLIAATALALAPGCAGQGPLASRRTTIGSLKASVVQLEREKEGLRRDLAEMKAENRRVADRYLQEKEANDALISQLDDARSLLGQQGIDAGDLGPPDRSLDGTPSRPDRVKPVTRPRSGRKPPMAEIRGDLRAVPYPDEDDPIDDFPALEPDDQASRRRPDRDDRQARLDPPIRWLPIANGVSESAAPKR